MTSTPSHVHTKKRIIICCDGTWMNNDGDVQIPSNVTRLCRALKQDGFDKQTKQPISQIIYYNAGIGTEQNPYSKYIGGGTGAGLADHIKESYSFVCLNYNPGDEIFIIGFSRGAFSARSISSLISDIGLLTPQKGLAYFIQIFEDWEFGGKRGWTTRFPDEPWPHRPLVKEATYVKKLLDLKLTRSKIDIKCVAVWDTVGALGIPIIGLLPQPARTDFSFVDTKVAPNVEYAFQALGLDERRRSYAPTIWEKPEGQKWPVVLKQTWFPGVHSDIGGSYTNADLANITLAWMISQLDPLLDFDHSYVATQNIRSIELHEKKKEPVPEWGLGKIHDSMTLFFRLGGKKVRTPMEYKETDARKLKPYILLCLAYWFGIKLDDKGSPLKNTHEHVHSSVRIRMGRNGRGYDNSESSSYDSEALQGWVMHGLEVSPSQVSMTGAAGRMEKVIWQKKVTRKDDNGKREEVTLELPEDEIGGLERTIMEVWPEISRRFESIRPGAHQQSVRRSSTYPNDHPSSITPAGGQESRNGIGGSMVKPDRVETI